MFIRFNPKIEITLEMNPDDYVEDSLMRSNGWYKSS